MRISYTKSRVYSRAHLLRNISPWHSNQYVFSDVPTPDLNRIFRSVPFHFELFICCAFV